MLTGLLVFVGAPIFVLVLLIHIVYGLYKDYKEERKFKEHLKRKYPLAYEDKKQKEKVKIFAKKNGFGRVFYLGKYQGRDLYKALDAEPDKRTGKPSYILVHDGTFELRTGEQGMEIFKTYMR